MDSNIVDLPPNDKSGIYKAPPHSEGGFRLVIDNQKVAEAEGYEIELCPSVMESNEILHYENKTNKQILDDIFQKNSCVMTQGHTTSGSFIVCKKAVLDGTKKSFNGSIKDFINSIQSEHECKVTEDAKEEFQKELGGNISTEKTDNNILFMKWYTNWYKLIEDDMNVFISLPNTISPFKEKSDKVVILDLFEKTTQNIDAKPYLKQICDKADYLGVIIYLEPMPRYTFFLRNIEKRKKISKEYLVNYYSNFGFELTENKEYMKRIPISDKKELGGEIESKSNDTLWNNVIEYITRDVFSGKKLKNAIRSFIKKYNGKANPFLSKSILNLSFDEVEFQYYKDKAVTFIRNKYNYNNQNTLDYYGIDDKSKFQEIYNDLLEDSELEFKKELGGKVETKSIDKLTIKYKGFIPYVAHSYSHKFKQKATLLVDYSDNTVIKEDGKTDFKEPKYYSYGYLKTGTSLGTKRGWVLNLPNKGTSMEMQYHSQEFESVNDLYWIFEGRVFAFPKDATIETKKITEKIRSEYIGGNFIYGFGKSNYISFDGDNASKDMQYDLSIEKSNKYYVVYFGDEKNGLYEKGLITHSLPNAYLYARQFDTNQALLLIIEDGKFEEDIIYPYSESTDLQEIAKDWLNEYYGLGKYDTNELEKGIKVEEEHRDTVEKLAKGEITAEEGVKEIASSHLAEDPKYYDKLEIVENPFGKFIEVVKESKDFNDAFNKVKKIKDVPSFVAEEFSKKYNPEGKLSMEQSFKFFYDEHKGTNDGEYKIIEENRPYKNNPNAEWIKIIYTDKKGNTLIQGVAIDVYGSKEKAIEGAKELIKKQIDKSEGANEGANEGETEGANEGANEGETEGANSEKQELIDLIELLKETVKENPTDEDSKDALELYQETLDSFDVNKFENNSNNIIRLLAPNGKKSNLNEVQYKLVRTEAFKKWFGDWENSPKTASKVLDVNGEPAIFYHGTFSFIFHTFNIDKIGEDNLYGSGFYFTDNKDIAIEYSSKCNSSENSESNILKWINIVNEIIIPINKRSYFFKKYKDYSLNKYSKIYQKEFDGFLDSIKSSFIENGKLVLFYENLKRGDKILLSCYDFKNLVSSGLYAEFGFNFLDSNVKDVFLSIKNPINLENPVSYEDVDELIHFSHQYSLDKGWAKEEDAKYVFYWKHIFDKFRLPNKSFKFKSVKSIDDYEKGTEYYAIDSNYINNMWQHIINFRDKYPTVFEYSSKIDGNDREFSYGFDIPIRSDKKITWANLFWILTDSNWQNGKKNMILDFFKSKKYDGISHLGGWNIGSKPHIVYIAFNPNQIKYSDGSNINFNAKDDDMRFSSGGSIKRNLTYLGEVGGNKIGQKSSLEKAKSLEKQGISNEQIRQETGWFVNPHDKKWRFEISDMDFEIIKDFTKLAETLFLNKVKDFFTIKLNKVISHKALFDAYPEFNDISVIFINNGDASLSSVATPINQYEGRKDKLYLKYNFYDEHNRLRKQSRLQSTRPNSMQDNLRVQSLRNSERGIDGENGEGNSFEINSFRRNVLIHELQHVIQIREEFGAGSSSYEWYKAFLKESISLFGKVSDIEKANLLELSFKYAYNSSGEIEARDVEYRLYLTDNEKKNVEHLSLVNFDENYLTLDIEDPIFKKGGSLTAEESILNSPCINEKFKIGLEFKNGGEIKNMTKEELAKFYDTEEGKELDKQTYNKWKSLVNMSKGELEDFYNSKDGKEAGLSSTEAKEKGIDSGRESARWIFKMKDVPYTQWTPDMWRWAKKQISFISRMSGMKGDLYDEKGNKTRKHTALLIWGHNPVKYENGGGVDDSDNTFTKAINKMISDGTNPDGKKNQVAVTAEFIRDFDLENGFLIKSKYVDLSYWVKKAIPVHSGNYNNLVQSLYARQQTHGINSTSLQFIYSFYSSDVLKFIPNWIIKAKKELKAQLPYLTDDTIAYAKDYLSRLEAFIPIALKFEKMKSKIGVKKELTKEEKAQNERQKMQDDIYNSMPVINKGALSELVASIEKAVKPLEIEIYNREAKRYRELCQEYSKKEKVFAGEFDRIFPFGLSVFNFKLVSVYEMNEKKGYKDMVNYVTKLKLKPDWINTLNGIIKEHVETLKCRMIQSVIKNFEKVISPIKKISKQYLTIGTEGFEGSYLIEFENGGSLIFKTEAIGAGGYNIQVFHFRYISNFTDIKMPDGSKGNWYDLVSDDEFENGGAIYFDKVISASTRFRPSETVVFDPPLEGKNGAKLISYTWSYEWTMKSSSEGELVSKRVSDWTQAEISADTGRDIVHQYTILMPNEEHKTVSSDSVPVLLGYLDKKELKSFPNLVTASKTLAKQQMQLAILEAQKKEYDELYAKFEKAEKPEIKEVGEDGKFQAIIESYKKGAYSNYSMGDVVFRQDNDYIYETQEYKKRPITRDTIEQLTWQWISKRVAENGGINPRGLYDLKNRVVRQKRKVENILNTKMEKGGTVLSNNEIIKNIYFSDNTDIKHGRYDFSFETEDSEGASMFDYDGYIIESPSSSRMNDEIEWGQNTPEDWENAENILTNSFYEWKKSKMEKGGEIEDFDFSSLFNEESAEEKESREKQEKISEEQEKEEWYQKSKFSKKWASTLKEAIDKTVKSYFDAKTTYDDWSSRQYKSNKGNVYAGGDDIHGAVYTIGGINENRRQNTLRGAKMQMEESIEDLKSLGLNKDEIDHLLFDKNGTLFASGGKIEVNKVSVYQTNFSGLSFSDLGGYFDSNLTDVIDLEDVVPNIKSEPIFLFFKNPYDTRYSEKISIDDVIGAIIPKKMEKDARLIFDKRYISYVTYSDDANNEDKIEAIKKLADINEDIILK